MCLYERTKFSACGHFTWSAVQEICAYWYKMMDKEQNCIKLCPFKRVRKINHAEIGLRCPPCTRPQIFAPPSHYEALKTGWLPEGLICIIGPRVTIKACEDLNCLLLTGHALPHHYSADCDLLLCKFLFHIDSLEQDVRWWQVATSREIMDRLAENSKEIALRMDMLNLLVLEAMEILTSQTDRVRGQEWSVTASPQPVQGLPEALLKKMDDSAQAMPMKLPMRLRPAVAWRSKRRLLNTGTTSPGSECPYSELDFSCNQIRLFELHPLVSSSNISGSFHCVDISTAPEYTALSYTWGKGSASSTIEVHGHGAIDVRENLFEFLQQQARGASQPKLFWIDAICINQSNVHERNHQVNLMKRIYAEAKQVYVWLGKEANNSDLAMGYVSLKGKGPLVKRGPGYARLWSKKEGRALVELFERPYWRRMWIIQEIIHAGRLTVCCGNKWFEWDALESLFLKLKKVEDTSWLAHHAFAINVFQSPACVMAWQRAYWRHPETPAPKLRLLIEVFRDWKCTDLRDKVFALVSMASNDTTIPADYSLSTLDLYFLVQRKHQDAKWQFLNMLSQVLGITGRDITFFERDLIDYKVRPAEKLLLQSRIYDKDGFDDDDDDYYIE